MASRGEGGGGDRRAQWASKQEKVEDDEGGDKGKEKEEENVSSTKPAVGHQQKKGRKISLFNRNVLIGALRVVGICTVLYPFFVLLCVANTLLHH